MKKIIATVLAMVMALALCSTAFAASSDVTGYAKYTDEKDNYLKDKGEESTFTFRKAVAPKYDDGDLKEVGSVAYYTCDDAGGKYFVAVSTSTEADLVVYTKDDYKAAKLYLVEVATPEYYIGEALTFGTKCGDTEKPDSYISGYTYYSAETVGGDVYAYADEDGEDYVLVDGKLITVTMTDEEVETVAHKAVATVESGKVTGYTCSVCGAKALKAGNYISIPDDAEIIDEVNYWYFPATTSSSTSTNTNKADSAKTFDAGIALYAGMALTSVAGSAVVLGKKKEF